ncbi:hypothetical protein AX16_003805 [Volvariella volvacea WC 439]|nr:hypothetical protein AX16_003805 [Volvariella volvacea WC 439]
MQRPSLLDTEEPLEALFHHFNLAPTTFHGATLPETYDFPVLEDAHMPTHALALFQTGSDPDKPLALLPIDINRWESGFRVELALPDTEPGTIMPVPHRVPPDSDRLFVALPVVRLTVPHVESMPLLLLFGLSLETRSNVMAWRLLPPNVIGEFPHAPTMAQVFAYAEDDVFDTHHQFNLGLWKNVLALGLQNTRLVEMIQTAWNVTVEAKKIRRNAVGFQRR